MAGYEALGFDAVASAMKSQGIVGVPSCPLADVTRQA